MDDYISRELVAVGLALKVKRRDFDAIDLQDAQRFIASISPAEVRPAKEGYWIENCTDCTCSACGGVVSDEIVYMLQSRELPGYCPNCGAKMGGAE